MKDVFKELSTSQKGISEKEAKKRLKKYGENKLEVSQGTPKWLLFLLQFKDVLTIMLVVAAGMSLLIQNYRDAIVMLAIVVINVVIGFFQEFKAEKIMSSLKKLIQSPAKVYRDGGLKEIEQKNLVPGDVISLEEGDKVPADIRIIESNNLRTNEVALTGESMPQEKQSNPINEESPLGDRSSMAYMGTNVASGSAKGVVVSTGTETEMGKIASLTQEEEKSESPLQEELRVVANQLAILAVIIGILLFGVSIYRGLNLYYALIYGLGITVAIVPQALPMQVTVSLSQGVARMSEKNAIVKKLSSVETLGSTNVISTDKTGTLTKNEMTVKTVWFNDQEYKITGLGYEPEGDILHQDDTPVDEEEKEELESMFDAATMSSNAEVHPPDDDHAGWYPIGDPTEAALITLSTKLGIRSPKEDEENPEIHEFSFDSERKRMSSIREFEDSKVLTMKGALNSVLSIAKYIYKNGEKVEITEQDKKKLNDINEKYSNQALRVLAVAHRELGPDETDYEIDKIERDVVFLGLVAMIDPPKEGVKEAIADAHQAHIDTYIMTGDHAITAKAIAEEINLGGDKEAPVITNQKLEELSDEKLKEKMKENRSLVFSRVSPENKLRIVQNLKEEDKIVAVTGDGVNDAPALKSAHIGVAMGQMGTDVSKETAEMILLDDSYPTLVHAIKEGRTIYNNLKKTVLGTLTSNAAELLIVLLGLIGAVLLNWPIPILAIQILAIDLLAEILPLTALTFDPGSEELMTTPPRDRDEHIINQSSAIEVSFLGIMMGGLAFINYALFVSNIGGVFTNNHALYPRATTITYLTIVICQLLNILSRRYKFTSLFNKNFFNNKKMLYSIVISIGLVLSVVYVPGLNSYMDFAPLPAVDWLRILIAGGIFLLSFEGIKWYKRKRAFGEKRSTNKKGIENLKPQVNLETSEELVPKKDDIKEETTEDES
uniref:cation-translocating P-type ATPase n=1 Tax=unclassified Candidatus Frackibacter TaxID=2648818 RepID=UPI002100873C|nr:MULTISPECIES: cation-transporting P-type ATPase [unclassified Candidatus Frackibacter]